MRVLHHPLSVLDLRSALKHIARPIFFLARRLLAQMIEAAGIASQAIAEAL